SPTTEMRMVSCAPFSRDGSASIITDHSKSIVTSGVLRRRKDAGWEPGAIGARRLVLRLGAEPFLVDRGVAAVRLHGRERLVHPGDEVAALGEADAVFVRHHLFADSLHLPVSSSGDVVEDV